MMYDFPIDASEHCIDISTTFDQDPNNEDKYFNVTLSTSDPKVFITPTEKSALVIIENCDSAG